MYIGKSLILKEGTLMKKVNVGYLIITSAIIWGGVILSCALKLRGTPYKDGVSLTLTLGVIAHLLFVWTPLGALRGKRTKADASEK
jgi:hypothetical protein